jgi:futalosine hydrolase
VSRPLILVPTPLEQARLSELGGFPGEFDLELCGFGPVCAAARAAERLAARRPSRVLLVGLAGALGDQALASALAFTQVRLDGVGAGVGADFRPASRLGWPQWHGEDGAPVEETLALVAAPGTPARELLTVCAAAASPAEARARAVRYPEAVAEEMEGFGVALACRLAGVALTIVRGLSNRAGERDPARWQTRAALAAARTLALAELERAPASTRREDEARA